MLLDSFITEMNKDLYICEKTTTRNSDYTISTSYTKGSSSYKVLLYSKSMAERYFGVGMWKEVVKYVAIAKPFTLTNEVHVEIDSVEYAVDSVDDVAFQGEVMLIGLRDVR